MRLEMDDDTATVDSTFLGPAGYTLPWEARFVSYGIGFGLAVVAFLLEHRAGIGLGLWSVVFTLLAVVAATRWIGKHLNFETPPRQLAVIAWHEVSAPRRKLGHRRSVLVPVRVVVNKPTKRQRLAAGLRAMVAPTDGGK